MIWVWYALIASILISFVTIIEKRVLQKAHAREFVAVLSIANLLVSLPLFFRIDYSRITFSAVLIVLGTSTLSVVCQIYNARSLKHLDISSASPLYVTTPAITAVLAFIILGESLSLFQIGGIIAILIGTYILELKGKNIFSPFIEIRKSTYLHLIIISIVLYGINSLIARYVLSHAVLSPEALIAFTHLFLAIMLNAYFAKSYNGWSGIQSGFRAYGVVVLGIALLTVLYRYMEVKSLALMSVGLVVAIIKSSSLFSTVIGGKLFGEKNLLIKSIACSIIIVGMCLVIL